MQKEFELRTDYLGENPTIETIYFGGGTPSVLSLDELQNLFDSIQKNFAISNNVEITLEANPDDLDAAKIKELKSSPVNRLSIGVQSFFDDDLKLLNRIHSGEEAKSAIMRSQDVGFENITIDFIYAIPGLTNEKWKQNLQTGIDLQIPHISAYCLTVEERTPLEAFIKKGQIKPVDETQSIEQFEILMGTLHAAGFEHYEISNFAKPGFHSKHNSAYWSGEKYLGIGPSAHSFDGESRQWNVAHNIRYAQNVLSGNDYFDKEILSESNKANEFILTRLRLSSGVEIPAFSKLFGNDVAKQLSGNAQDWLESGHLIDKNGFLKLSRSGKFLADRIASDLFVEI